MTSQRRLTGMPVVSLGRLIGRVERATLTRDGRRLYGLVVRRGLGAAKWLPAGQIVELGERAVLAEGAPRRLPGDAQQRLGPVYHAQGLCLGRVADAVLHTTRLTVLALEISFGPLYQLAGRCAYATEYTVRPGQARRGAEPAPDVVVAELKPWQAVGALDGKEAERECP